MARARSYGTTSSGPYGLRRRPKAPQRQINAGGFLSPGAKQYVQSQGQTVLYPGGPTRAPLGGPGAPGSPAPYQPAQLPLDPLYDATAAGINRNYDISSGDLGYQEQQVRQSYGFDDASNPYSRKNLLEQAYQQGQARTTNSMAAQGQLYAGATQRGLDYGTQQYNQNLDTTRRSYQDALHSIAVQRQQAESDRTTGLGTAYGERVDRASQIQPEDPSPQQAMSQHQTLMGFGAKKAVGLGGGKWRVNIGGKTVTVRFVNGQIKRA